MTTLNERPTEVGGSKDVRGSKRFLVLAAVALLVAALVGVSTRVLSDQGTTSPDEEIQLLLGDYLTAWETKDEAAVRSVTIGEAFVINEYAYTFDSVGFRLNYHVVDNVDGVISEGFGYNWSTEHVGDLMVTGEGPWFVSVEEIWEETGYSYKGQANYTIVEVDGEFKIANHYWAGLRSYRTD